MSQEKFTSIYSAIFAISHHFIVTGKPTVTKFGVTFAHYSGIHNNNGIFTLDHLANWFSQITCHVSKLPLFLAAR